MGCSRVEPAAEVTGWAVELAAVLRGEVIVHEEGAVDQVLGRVPGRVEVGELVGG